MLLFHASYGASDGVLNPKTSLRDSLCSSLLISARSTGLSLLQLSGKVAFIFLHDSESWAETLLCCLKKLTSSLRQRGDDSARQRPWRRRWLTRLETNEWGGFVHAFTRGQAGIRGLELHKHAENYNKTFTVLQTESRLILHPRSLHKDFKDVNSKQLFRYLTSHTAEKKGCCWTSEKSLIINEGFTVYLFVSEANGVPQRSGLCSYFVSL